MLRKTAWLRPKKSQFLAPLLFAPRGPSDDLAPGTLNSILKQAGLREQP